MRKGHEQPVSLLLKRDPLKREFATPSAGFDDFSSAYREAAAWLSGTHTDGGFWALPIVFLYRHAIEVLMKAILTNFGKEAGICPECVLRRSHNLEKQLPDLKQIARHSGLELSEQLSDFIGFWHKTDSNGMKARYPITMDGKRDRLEHEDAFQLKPFVDSCDLVLDELEELLNTLYDNLYSDILREEGLSN